MKTEKGKFCEKPRPVLMKSPRERAALWFNRKYKRFTGRGENQSFPALGAVDCKILM